MKKKATWPDDAASHEPAAGIKNVIMSDERDFNRPLQPWIANPMSTDSNSDEDGGVLDSLEKAWDYIKEKVTGDEPKEEPKPEEIKPEEVKSEESKPAEAKDKPAEEIKDKPVSSQKSSSIKEFQSFLSQTNPILGSLYTGPTSGESNPEFIAAMKNAESIIAKEINNNKVLGSLWSDSKAQPNTTTDDLKASLDLIAQHKANKTAHRVNYFKQFLK